MAVMLTAAKGTFFNCCFLFFYQVPKIITFSKNIATMQIQEWAATKMKTGIMMMRVIAATAVFAVLAVIMAMVIQPTLAIRAVAMMTAEVTSTLVVLSTVAKGTFFN